MGHVLSKIKQGRSGSEGRKNKNILIRQQKRKTFFKKG